VATDLDISIRTRSEPVNDTKRTPTPSTDSWAGFVVRVISARPQIGALSPGIVISKSNGVPIGNWVTPRSSIPDVDRFSICAMMRSGRPSANSRILAGALTDSRGAGRASSAMADARSDSRLWVVITRLAPLPISSSA